jgi:hypothetical protein
MWNRNSNASGILGSLPQLQLTVILVFKPRFFCHEEDWEVYKNKKEFWSQLNKIKLYKRKGWKEFNYKVALIFSNNQDGVKMYAKPDWKCDGKKLGLYIFTRERR